MATILDFDPRAHADRVAALSHLGRALKSLVRQHVSRQFSHEMLVMAIQELAKNTFDHSNGVGQVELELPSATTPLVVVYRDYGAPFDWAANAQLGLTSKPSNGINAGMGLALIERCAESLGCELTVVRTVDCTEVRLAQAAPRAQGCDGACAVAGAAPKLSATKLARKHDVPVVLVQTALIALGYLEDKGGLHFMTDLGRSIGGEWVKNHPGSSAYDGGYVAWPEDLELGLEKLNTKTTYAVLSTPAPKFLDKQFSFEDPPELILKR